MSLSKGTVGLFLVLSPWCWAEPKLNLEVRKASDQVELKLIHAAPLENVVQKWRENPHRLDITIPKSEFAGKSNSFKIDKGVVQKVEVKPAAGSVTISILALQNPKMSWVGSDDRRSWTLRIMPLEMASSTEPPRLPGQTVATAPKASPKALPGLAVQSSRPAPVQVRPPSPGSTPGSRPTSTGPEQKLISVSFQNKDLAAAIREMAQAAGLEADIGAGVEGTVTASFSEVPLARALTNVLGKQTRFYEFKIVNNRLQVTADSNSGGATLVPSGPGQTPRSVNLVSDYFPILPEKSVSELAPAVRKAVADVEVLQDDRLNVLFVRGDAADVEKVRNLLQKVIAK